ncbi:MAG: GNAT family N-acetyltransferase [Synergistes sp.]|nr:GNAT family N-acetyltransferase [Synergistes sp.]
MRIRPVRPEDADAIDKINREAAKGDFFCFSKGIKESASELINRLSFLDHLFVLESDTEPNTICGACLLQVDSQIFLRRVATLRVIVKESCQGQGLGRALIKAALDLADNELMLERVEVEIPTNNVGALKMCKSVGFKVEGTAKDWIRTPDGSYVDAYLMAHCKN